MRWTRAGRLLTLTNLPAGDTACTGAAAELCQRAPSQEMTQGGWKMQGEIEKKITPTSDSWSLSRSKLWNQIVYLFLAHIPQYEIQLNYLMSQRVITATYKIQLKRRHAVTMEEREKADRDYVQKFKSCWEFRKLHTVCFSIRNNTRMELIAYISEK